MCINGFPGGASTAGMNYIAVQLFIKIVLFQQALQVSDASCISSNILELAGTLILSSLGFWPAEFFTHAQYILQLENAPHSREYKCCNTIARLIQASQK